ncbi:MAG: transporter, periplasmic substrate-binding protein [Myxococcaceae bacterium]|nr:transporter, periplasmic substrate-binding protein [Myxococcaceae bacterium]
MLARFEPVYSSSQLVAARAVFVVLFSVGMAACSKEPSTKRADGLETLVLRYQGYPTLVGMTELAEELGFLAPIKLDYTGSTISGPQNIQSVATGDVDYGGAFNGAVVKLIASKVPVRAVIAYYGTDRQSNNGFYVLPESPIKGGRDLIGKKIAVNTLGAHSEFCIREYLAREGLTAAQAKQVQMVVLPPGSAEQALRDKQVDAAALQTIQYEKAQTRGDLRLLFSDHQLFGDFNAGSYVLREDFIKNNPNTVRHFVRATARAIEWARSHPREEVIARLESTLRRRGPNEDISQLKYWKSATIATRGGAMRDADFQLWIDWLVKDGQLKPGQVEPKQIYTNEFQEGPGQLAARSGEENR